MREKLGIGLVIIIIAGGCAAALRHSANRLVSATASDQTVSFKMPASCLIDKQSIGIPPAAEASLDLVVMNQILTVPAGTNDDIDFSSYNAQRAVGSEHYGSGYGNYNFVAVQTGHSRGLSIDNSNVTDSGWKVTQFRRCRD